MAIFHFSAKTVSRASGRSSTAAAAYRSGERIVDERTGEIHDYTRRGGVVDSRVFLPGGGTMNRADLWNKVEAHHKRGDALVAREFVVALPAELRQLTRDGLARRYAQELADRYGVAVDIAIHSPGKEGDDRNHHAHILLSACYCDPEGKLGKKAVELDPIHCARAKIENAVEAERVRWQDLANQALQLHGHEARIDHRSLEAQGITDRTPSVHLGPEASAIERRGQDSQITERERAKVAELVAMAQAGAAIEQAQARTVQELEAELAQLIAERDKPKRTRWPTDIRLELKPLEAELAEANSTLYNAGQARPRALEKAKIVEAIEKSGKAKRRLQAMEKQHQALATELQSTPWWRPFKRARLEKAVPPAQAELASVRDQAAKYQEIAKRPVIENIEAAELAAHQVIAQARPKLDALQEELDRAEQIREQIAAAAAEKAQELARAQALEQAQEYEKMVAELKASPAYQAKVKARQLEREQERERAEAERTRGPSPGR